MFSIDSGFVGCGEIGQPNEPLEILLFRRSKLALRLECLGLKIGGAW